MLYFEPLEVYKSNFFSENSEAEENVTQLLSKPYGMWLILNLSKWLDDTAVCVYLFLSGNVGSSGHEGVHGKEGARWGGPEQRGPTHSILNT